MSSKVVTYNGQPVTVICYTLREGKRFAYVRLPDGSEQWVLCAELIIESAA